MHPAARVFQLVFLIAGLILGVVGYSIYYEDYQQSTQVNVSWSCRMVGEEQACTSEGGLNPGERDEAFINLTASIVLILASGVVTLGGRRKTPAAPAPVQGAPMGPPMPMPMPQQPVPGVPPLAR